MSFPGRQCYKIESRGIPACEGHLEGLKRVPNYGLRRLDIAIFCATKAVAFGLTFAQEPVINIGEIAGDYHFEPQGPDPFFHWRPVKWIGEAVPRTNFGQDLLYTMGAFLTICRVQRNNAEARIKAMRSNGWRAETITAVTGDIATADDEEAEETDLEALAQDQIAQLIAARFKGHSLTRL